MFICLKKIEKVFKYTALKYVIECMYLIVMLHSLNTKQKCHNLPVQSNRK